MTQLTLLTKSILIYICIGIVFTSYGHNVANNPADSFISTNTTTGELTYNQEFRDNMPNANRSSGLWSFIDVVASVLGFMTFIVGVIFFPLSFFLLAGLPPIVTLLFGVPLLILMSFGLIYLFRSGQ